MNIANELGATHIDKMLEHSIAWGNRIREEANLNMLFFDGFESPSYDINIYQKILDKFLDYEQKVPALVVLHLIYGDIARAYLNVQDFNNALQYGVAYLVANSKSDPEDDEGILAAYNVLTDIAVASFNFDKAIDFFHIANSEINASNSHVLKSITEAAESQKRYKIKPLLKIPNDLTTVKMPKTFSLIEDNEETRKEKAIRSIMYAMNCSRSTATRYVREAQSVDRS